jgi:hypothetical protein
MAPSSDYVRLQILVVASRRNDKGLDEVQQALRNLGLEITGTGKASISARVTPEVLANVFDTPATDVSERAVDSEAELRVPASLAGYVDSITIAPQHIAMSDRPQAGKRR